MCLDDFSFFISHLRFVANRTERSTDDVGVMMDALLRIATQIEGQNTLNVSYIDAHLSGRALAGVAGFLQQHILPEIVAAKNQTAEIQVRWVIDTCMSLMSTLMVHVETHSKGESCELVLPDPPK